MGKLIRYTNNTYGIAVKIQSVGNFAKSHIKRKTGKSGEIMRLYLRTRDARFDIHCCRNTKLQFRDKDDTVANNCNNINASARH